ncbi:DUF2946 family protein [Roseibium sp. HPY-6]|uniref:DUF2946 family protein n=1 Tax=Roseibium sp. HPY-6 TaxID=3229852 RepID=UPI00338FF991
MLLMLPFFMSALVPQGYMPALQADGSFTVTICTPEGFRTVTLDANGVEIPSPSEGDEPASFDHCVFAGVGAFLGSQQALEVWPLSVEQETTLSLRDIALAKAAIAGTLGARAPPRRV